MPRLLHRRRERGPISDPVASGAPATLLNTYFTEYWLASQYSGSGSWLGEKGVADLALPGGSANPTFCGHSTSLNPFGAGVEYVAFPGTNSNYVTTPDAASNSITGDITLVGWVCPNDWTPSVASTIVGKYVGSGNQISYLLRINSSGGLSFFWSEDGAAAGLFRNAVSTVATGFTDGTAHWCAVTLDVDDGAGNRVVKFWTSDNGTSWTQLGTTVTTVGTTSIFNSTSELSVGDYALGVSTVAMNGSIARAQVYSGVRDFSGTPSGGTLVADFNPAGGTFGVTETTLTGTGDSLTWTINRSTSGRRAYAITRDCWWFGTDDYLSTPDNALFDFGASQDFTVASLFRSIQDADSNYRMLITKRDGAGAGTGWAPNVAGTGVTQEFGTIIDSLAGAASWPTDASWNNPGQLQSHITTRTNGATGDLVVYADAVSVATGTDAGDLSNALAVSVGRQLTSGSGSNFFEGLIYGLGISRTGLDATQVTTLDTELRGMA